MPEIEVQLITRRWLRQYVDTVQLVVACGWGASITGSAKIALLRDASSLSEGADPANATVLRASSKQRNKAFFIIPQSPNKDRALSINEVIGGIYTQSCKQCKISLS